MSIELDKFKQDMRLRGRPEEVVSVVIRGAQQQIVKAVDQIINNYISEAKQEGIAKGVDDFVQQLRATHLGSSYSIITDSGKTDFTTPPFPMLPKLLKNAKVAKDGSTYKVIPMKPNKNKKKSRSTVDIMRQINAERKATRQEQEIEKNSGGEVTFRTASSKQDAGTKWVHPGKEADMTYKLRDINARMGLAIDNIINSVINSHRGDWA